MACGVVLPAEGYIMCVRTRTRNPRLQTELCLHRQYGGGHGKKLQLPEVIDRLHSSTMRPRGKSATGHRYRQEDCIVVLEVHREGQLGSLPRIGTLVCTTPVVLSFQACVLRVNLDRCLLLQRLYNVHAHANSPTSHPHPDCRSGYVWIGDDRFSCYLVKVKLRRLW